MADPRTAGRTPALLGLILLPMLLLAPSLFGDRALVGVHTASLSPWRASLPQALVAAASADSLALYADKTLQGQPLLALSLERLLRGELPLWNPDSLAGVPLLAQAYQAALYPPTWLGLVLPWPATFAWLAWLQAALAGLSMALLARELGRGWAAAFLAGTTYMLCGFLSARWHWYQIHGCAAWLPLALWGVERSFGLARAADGGARLLSPASWRALAAAALAVGCALLTGWIQSAVHTFYLGSLWGLSRLVPLLRGDRQARRRGLVAATRCGLGLGLGLALAAPQLLTTFEFVGSGGSARAEEPPSVVRSIAMDPVGLAALVAPDVFGHPRDLARHPEPLLRSGGALRQALYEPGDNDNFVEGAATIGLFALVLALYGAARAHRGRGPALACLLAGPLLALDTPLVEALAHLPGLAIGDPQRFLLLTGVGGALLAGAGLQRLLEAPPSAALRRTCLTLAALAAVVWLASQLLLNEQAWATWLAGRLAPRLGLPEPEILARGDALAFDLGLLRASLARVALVLAAGAGALVLLGRGWRPGLALVLLVCVADQAYTGWRNATSVPAAQLFEAPPELAALRGDGDGRLLRVHPLGTRAGTLLPLPPNTGTPFHVPDLGGYYGLSPARMVALFEALEPGSTENGLGLGALRPDLLDHPILDVLAVDRVLTTADVVPGVGVARGEAPTAVGDALLWRRPSARPRAWFTTSLPVADGQEALARVSARGWLATGPAIVEPVDGVRPPRQAPWPADRPVPSVLREEFTPEHLRLSLNTPAEGLVVLADTWNPGWSATLDGAPVTIFPAYHALRAMVVPPGQHTIELRYRSPAFSAGAAAAALALLTLLATGLLAFRAR